MWLNGVFFVRQLNFLARRNRAGAEAMTETISELKGGHIWCRLGVKHLLI